MDENNVTVKPSTKWWMLILALAAWCIAYISYLGYSSDTITMMEMFGLNYTQVGALASYPAIINGLLSLVCGLFITGWGSKKVIVAGLFLCTISEAIWAFSPNYTFLMIARLIGGVGLPLVFVTTLCIAMEWFADSDSMPTAMAIFNSGEGLGSVLALYIFAFVLIHFGFRVGSIIGTVLIFIVAIICIFGLKDKPKQTTENTANGSGLKELVYQYIGCFKNANVVMSTIVSCGVWSVYSMAVYWIPTILIEDAGYGQTFAGLMGTCYPLAGIVGGFIAGAIASKSGQRKLFVWLNGLLAALCCLLMPFAYNQQSWVMLNVLFLASGFFTYAEFPMVLTLVGETLDTEFLGTANGMISGVGALLGGSVLTLLIGAIKDSTESYFIGFIVLGVSCLLLLFAPGLFVKEKKSSTPSETTM